MGRRSRKRGVLSDADRRAGGAAAPRPAPAPRAGRSPTRTTRAPGRRAAAAVAPGPADRAEHPRRDDRARAPPSSAAGRPRCWSGSASCSSWLATGELALREHLAGYRSHSALLAGLGGDPRRRAAGRARPAAEGRRPRRGGRRLPRRAAAAARPVPPALRRRELACVTAAARSCWIRTCDRPLPERSAHRAAPAAGRGACASPGCTT